MVTMPGTDFMVAYRKVQGVVMKMHGDDRARVTQSEFLARACGAAND